MAHKYKLVGNLVFNQEDGEVLHAKTAETLAKFPVKLAIPVHLFASQRSIAIDSTGVKFRAGHFELLSEALKHLKEAYFLARLGDPTATDAEVEISLVDTATGTEIVTLTYAGEGGKKKSSNIAETLKTYPDKMMHMKCEVVTASATSGATQIVYSVVLELVYDFT